MSRSAVPRSRVVQVLAAVAAVGLVPVALTAAQLPRAADQVAQPAADPPSFTTKWIAIQTGATSKITLNDSAGQLGAAQTLAPAANCGVNQGATSTRYVSFTGTVGDTTAESLASYQAGSIGVKEKKSGTSCYRVDTATAETLDLQLGAALNGTAGGKTIASSAFLDLEMKQSARILATATLGGVFKASFELQSGTSVGLPGIATTPPTTCTGSADSGPDSGINDNCRWAISVPSWLGTDDGIYFDQLSLKAVSGSFSLEGGADGSYDPAPVTPANASIIEVTDAVLGCGQKTQTIAAAGDAPQVYVTRLGNLDASPCELVPYTLDTGAGYAQFLKPLGAQVTAQFVWDLVWSFDHTTSTTLLPDVTIDYESGAPENPTTLGWCPDPQYDANGTFTGLANGPGADQDSTLDGVQFACVISRSARAVDGNPDRVASHDQVYVYGDARMGSG